MPIITALPETTSRVLRSGQVITKPTSLIKELIDNAIDAKASSIDILISANTLDKIQVRDNGHGIAPDDLEALGRHGHTSKLKNLEELMTLGGSSLGFRGEALASAVELGEVTITTRTEGETVGTAIKLKASGGISSQTSTSHPIGTTVCVLNFLSKIPVRKEVALKESKKTLSAIKDLIQSYALARLNLRLCLKVLKNDKANWSFYPRPNSGIREVVSHFFGRNTAAQCIERNYTSLNPDNSCMSIPRNWHRNTRQSQHLKFRVQAFLPNANADVSKIGGGPHISVDSRPVSCSRGTFKKIISIFKSHIRALQAHTASEIKDPFIRLNIICPSGSYDVNVEPAKDNVLFKEEHLVLAAVDSLFKDVYGYSGGPGDAKKQCPPKNVGEIDILLSRRDPSAHTPAPLSTNVPDPFSLGGLGSRVTDCPSYTTRNKILGLTSSGSSVCEELPQQVNEKKLGSDRPEYCGEGTYLQYPSGSSSPVVVKRCDAGIDGLNPWIIAKLNASTFKKVIGASSITHSKWDMDGKRPVFTSFRLSTPCQPSKPRSSSNHPYLTPSKRLDNWINQKCINRFDNSEQVQLHDSYLSSGVDRHSGYLNEPCSSDDRGLTQIDNLFCAPKMPTLRKPLGLNKPFVSPLISPQPTVHQNCSKELQQTLHFLPSRRPQKTTSHSKEALNADLGGSFQRGPAFEVEDALEFERRKEEATRRLRKRLRNPNSQVNLDASLASFHSTPRSPPYQNPYSAATAALDVCRRSLPSVISGERRPIEVSLPDDDPRAYLIRRQKSIAASSGKVGTRPKLKRVKIMLLPLEVTPEHAKLHDLIHVVAIDIGPLSSALAILANYDQYSKSGNQALAFSTLPLDLPKIKRNLEDLLKRWVQGVKGTGDDQVDISLDLSELQGSNISAV